MPSRLREVAIHDARSGVMNLAILIDISEFPMRDWVNRRPNSFDYIKIMCMGRII